MAVYGTFRGRGGRFVGGLGQSGRVPGHIRISVASMGWDKVYSRLTAIPPRVKNTLKRASNQNANMVADIARENAPELNRDLRDSIKATLAQDKGTGGWMSTVTANTPYAHFVEMDAHPSYKWNGFPPSVFGDSPGQGPPQGSHYLARAMAQTNAQSQLNINNAVNMGIQQALRTATTKRGLDFTTKRGQTVAPFIKSAIASGMTIGVADTFGGIVPIQSMELEGL